jgi:hypothetical protein
LWYVHVCSCAASYSLAEVADLPHAAPSYGVDVIHHVDTPEPHDHGATPLAEMTLTSGNSVTLSDPPPEHTTDRTPSLISPTHMASPQSASHLLSSTIKEMESHASPTADVDMAVDDLDGNERGVINNYGSVQEEMEGVIDGDGSVQEMEQIAVDDMNVSGNHRSSRQLDGEIISVETLEAEEDLSIQQTLYNHRRITAMI